MIRKICLLSCHNQYASKRYFTQKLYEALVRAGVDAHIFAWPHGPFPEELVSKVHKIAPDMTASFHQLPEQEDGKYFWDRLKIPHWTILLDPAFYDLELIRSPFSHISCVDRDDCELLLSYHFENTFFFPHAVEKELVLPRKNERPIDVIMLGTCYDPDSLYDYWKKNYSKQVVEVLEDAVTRVLNSGRTTFLKALLQSLTFQGLSPREVDFDRLANYVDSYTRGIDRLNLIRSIKGAHIHVYGGSCWREEKPIRDWSHYLAKQSNVTIHPPVNFAEALELLKQSKICLNSMPFFKNGSHERIFASLACGAVPLTSDNLYLREVFEEGKDLLFYQSNTLDSVDEAVNTLLADASRQQEMVAAGQTKVKKDHTWDSRVAALDNVF